MSFALIGFGLVLLFFSHFIISISKAFKRASSVRRTSVTISIINNVVHNPAVLSDIQLLFVSFCFVVTASIPKVINGKPPETADLVFAQWVPLRWFFFIYPILFLYFNPNIIEHLRKDFWDWAPNWLQKYNPYLYRIPV